MALLNKAISRRSRIISEIKAIIGADELEKGMSLKTDESKKIAWISVCIMTLIGIFSDSLAIGLLSVPLSIAVGVTNWWFYPKRWMKSIQMEWHKNIPMLIRILTIALSSGMNVNRALYKALESIGSNKLYGHIVAVIQSDLERGIALRQILLLFQSVGNHRGAHKICQLLWQFEQTGSSIILYQLAELVEELVKDEMRQFEARMNQSDLAAMLPTGIIFFNMMVLLMSPIFLQGGLL